jgi:hypothetical protein
MWRWCRWLGHDTSGLARELGQPPGQLQEGWHQHGARWEADNTARLSTLPRTIGPPGLLTQQETSLNSQRDGGSPGERFGRIPATQAHDSCHDRVSQVKRRKQERP